MSLGRRPVVVLLTFLLFGPTIVRGWCQSPEMPELESLIESIETLQTRTETPDEMMKLIQRRMGPFYPESRPFDGIEFFEKEIRPILAENCYSCHGSEKQKGDLRFDLRGPAFMQRDSGSVIVPGDPATSRLLQVVSHNEELKMPPDRKLDPGHIELLAQWIRIGAPWPEDPESAKNETSMDERIARSLKEHWAFQPVGDPGVPEVETEGWDENPIDAFIASRLEQTNLSPSVSADPASLLKRVYYDLTGLPPTYKEIESFLGDPTGNAYEEAIDRLLESPYFGERWGRFWLDVARYADTKGYVFNQERTFPYSHTYRDYVIRAFNQDLPYDRFLIEQIAADRLDLSEDKRPLAALGFLTLGRRFVGNIHDVVDDRIDVVTRGALGLTVTCARCHEHKFDPIPTEDYYSLYGVFRSSDEPDELPLIEEPDPENPHYQEYLSAIHEKKKDLEDYRDKVHQELLTEAKNKIEDYLLAVAEVWRATENIDYRKLRPEADLEPNLIREWNEYLKKRTNDFDPIFFPWKEYGLLSSARIEIESASLARRFAENPDSEKRIHPLLAKAFTQAGTPTFEKVVGIYVDLFKRADREWKNLLATSAQIAQQSGRPSIEFPLALPDADLETLREILYTEKGPLQISRDRVESLVDRDKRDGFTNRQNAIDQIEGTHPGRPNRAQLLVDSKEPFDPYVFKRGKPGSRGEDVPRRFLEVLDPGRKPFQTGSGRLELAQAIASPTNPLTARVYVNRVWAHLFGKPLVNTPSDFGLRSDPPTHPELLDHLAFHFMREGWSTKKIIKRIVLSKTYRQATDVRPEAAAIDPENRLLWRQNRRRLDFEALRDSLLLAAGRLDRTMGGFSVDITTEPFTTRRSVYSFIERQNLPALFRTFDFASPDMHSPNRFETLVPQQALFLLNSPFIAEVAESLVDRPEVTGELDIEDQVEEVYRLTLGREPKAQEKEMGVAFLSTQQHLPQETENEEPIWKYGYGKFNPDEGKITEFISFPYFGDEQWRIGSEYPDPNLGWVALNRLGGHPEVEHAVIRRWISPVTATISIVGHLDHDTTEGDGVQGYLVSSREGVLWSGQAHDCRIPTDVTATLVAPGETIDLVVESGPTNGWDSFVWHPRIWISEGETSGISKREWLSRIDFSGPPPPPPTPLNPLEQYAQVLLLTNEFLFVD